MSYPYQIREYPIDYISLKECDKPSYNSYFSKFKTSKAAQKETGAKKFNIQKKHEKGFNLKLSYFEFNEFH